MPWAARECAGRLSKSMPASSALPVAGIAPIMARNRVVFPAPLRPISPHIPPSSTVKEASRTIGMGPIDTLRPDTLNIGHGARCSLGPGTADQCLNASIAQSCCRRAVGDYGAVIKCQDTFGETFDDLHVVLHKEHGDVAIAQGEHDDLHQIDFFLNRDSTRRLVE